MPFLPVKFSAPEKSPFWYAMRVMSYFILAYYHFVNIENPGLLIKEHKKFFESRDVAGRIYISEQGINGQVSGSEADAEAYMDWLHEDPRFKEMPFKIHHHHEHVFARMMVKYRKQLVAIDTSVNLSKTGTHLSPKKWKEMLENEKDILLLDVRNRYEWEIGHFDRSTLPPLENFREFPAYAEELKKDIDPTSTKVMMCCTGGIRCELYSALLKEKGFEQVYQLDGGIINYGLQEGNAHWKGKLFVFDDRMAVTIDGKEAEPISICHQCHLPCDTYYNCANMDCNELFISCVSCSEAYVGCCSYECKSAPRVRPYDREGGNKPFRRKHLIKERMKDE